MAASHGEFELNAFLPLIADALLENLALLTKATALFRTKCIDLIEPNAERCRELLERSYAFATAYTTTLGYEKVNQIIEESDGNIELAKKLLDSAALD
ncbi:hypothetical protein [Dehalobacter sp. TBBPA1]|uniref:hypothetical protein n=1 Tax=Dehalobacter sp. TBBPA1 TaxID=3235037 RepID=UPI0034A15997